MKKNISAALLVCLIGLSFSYNGSATHIVGGEMNYTCLGNDQYEITLTVFRDCINGNPNAYFDDPASIGIFDQNNALITELGVNGQLLIALIEDDTLNPFLTDPCLVIPPDVCVHTTTYRDTLTLPFRLGGYQLAYQRCCRNQTIVNIIEPLASGATYGVGITEKALKECNTNAKFSEWPPLYICVNEPIFFDQSAVDIDGDSVVYRLCAPQLGADPMIPQPQPPNNPPYDPVNWVAPPYGINNMLNGLPGGAPLQIDLNTGLLTALPNTVGQFVVGICIEEYRDQEIISTTRRDFQYNVGICGVTVSSFFTPSIVCDAALTVNLTNQSDNADQYEWYFNDPQNPDFTSTNASPSYTYSDTGTYVIMLIAEPGNPCVDTFFQSVTVRYPSLTAAFDYEFLDCNNGTTIQVNDLSIDTLSNPIDWQWTLRNDEDSIYTSTLQNPMFTITTSGDYSLFLDVTAASGCRSNLAEEFSVALIDEFIETDTLQVCLGANIGLNPNFDDSYVYLWSPAETLNDPNLPNPRATPLETTTYQVVVADSSGTCTKNLEITIRVPIQITIELPPDTIICENTFLISPSVNVPIDNYFWSTEPNFEPIIGFDSSLLVSPRGTQTYYFLVYDEVGCFKIDSINVTGNGVDIAIDSLTILCGGDTTRINAINLDTVDQLIYQWSPAELILSGDQSASPLIQLDTVGTYLISLEASNQFGCTTQDTVVVAVLDTTPQVEVISFSQCSGFTIHFENSSPNAPFYIWDFGDTNTVSDTYTGINPTYTYPEAGDYQVQLTYPEYVPCADTILITVSIVNPEVLINFSTDFQTCGDSATVQFTDESNNGQTIFSDWQWSFSNGDTSSDQNPIVNFTEAGNYSAQLIISSLNGCTDTVTKNILVPIVAPSVPDSLVICPGDSLFINPDYRTDYIYQWEADPSISDLTTGNPLVYPSDDITYSVTVRALAELTCQLAETVTVIVPDLIGLNVSDDQTSCGDSVSFSALALTPVDFSWSSSPTFNNEISATDELTVLPVFSSTYYLQATDQFGCRETAEVNATSNTINVLSFDRTMCPGDTTELSIINLVPTMTLFYEWTPVADIIGSSTNQTIRVNPEVSTNFQVLLENEAGCSAEITAFVRVMGVPTDLFATADQDSILLGQTIQLEALTDQEVTYQWIAGEGISDPNISNPTALPLGPQIYTVVTTGENGCTQMASVSIAVTEAACDEPYVFFPNAFSPNGDGENEFLRVYGVPVEEAHWVIYNRWGESVFETFEVEGNWDGTYKGKLLPPDVYGYFLEVGCVNGARLVKKGNVTLLR